MVSDIEINAKLRNQYNPEGSHLRKVQMRALDLLCWVDSVLKKNNIPYFIEGGTLLGAVRHGGFIPWDDDIDIGIPKKYYPQVREAFLNEKHPQFVLQCRSTDDGCYKFWYVARDTKSKYIHTQEKNIVLESSMKYTGIQVDLFPMDNHVNITLSKYLYKLNLTKRTQLFLKNRFNSPFILSFLYSVESALRRICEVMTPAKKKWTYATGILFGTKWQYDEDVIFPLSTIKFEDHEFPAPHNVDAYLSIHYGNYMEIPDETIRNKHKLSNIEIWD